MDTPYDIVRIASTDSTQDVARSTFRECSRQTLVVADRQTAGRGRMGRQWLAPDRAMFSSLSFETQWPEPDQPLITLCTAVALADTIERLVGPAPLIKWPNDLMVEGHKIAGILVEAAESIVTVGCGVNLWWPDAPDYAGSLYREDPGPDIAIEMAVGWVDALLEILASGPRAWPRERYLERSWTVGRTVSWGDGTGRGIGIDEHGGLVVATDRGHTVLTAGEVHTHKEG